MFFLTCFSFPYDIVTFPLYFLIQKPWVVWNFRKKKHCVVEKIDERQILVKRIDEHLDSEYRALVSAHGTSTIPEFIERISQKYKDRKCMGYRRILAYCDGEFNGMPFRKISKSDSYEYISYGEMNRRTNCLASGIINTFNVKPKETIFIFASTRMEWMLSAIACIKAGCIVSTVVPSVTNDTVVHCLEQLQPKLIITESELLSKLLNASNTVESIKPPIMSMDEVDNALNPNIVLLNDVIEKGEKVPLNAPKMNVDDPALIIYTSGTTSLAKGVVLSHGNILSASEGFVLNSRFDGYKVQGEIPFMNYLPLSHVFEFTQEIYVLGYGRTLHYGSPYTLTDNSPGVMLGQAGDLTLAKAKVIGGVPLIFSRIKAKVMEKLVEKGPSFVKFFEFCLDYKLKWIDRGFTTPLLDKMIFGKIRQVLGGCLEVIMCGGAPMPSETHKFFNGVFGKTRCGYGASESCGGAIGQLGFDTETGNIGIPSHNCKVMLESWEEGGYFVSDPSGPAGEILLGGKNIASGGYFKHEDPYDNVAFTVDKDGTRWFRTGDIGRVSLESGSCTLIDRKKQLIKLQNGEYVALGNIEGVLSGNKYFEAVCVFARSNGNGVVAIAIPNKSNCAMLMGKNLDDVDEEAMDLLNDQGALIEKLLTDLKLQFGRLLTRYEMPKALCLVDGPWTPDNGLVTGALKIKRHAIEQKYRDQLNTTFKRL